MTRDYAKKPTPVKRPLNKRLLAIAVIVILFALILPTSFFVIHRIHQHQEGKTNKIVIAKNTTTKPAAVQQVASNGGQFDFYSMLPKIKVQVAKPPAIGEMPIPTNHQPYLIIQIATSSDHQAAEALITKLGVIGLTAYLQPIKNSNGSMSYRIITGPYANQQAASNDRALLNVNHYQNLLISMKAP